jgi:subtilisin family serine protease
MKFSHIAFLCAFLLQSYLTNAQDKAPNNWFLLDETDDKYRGVSVEKAYKLLKGKKSQPIIVAVIDGGVDVKHEDLKDVMWVNPKEIAGNGKDDDNNGYIDDINGWDFIGGKDGKDVSYDTYELTREYGRLKPLYEKADVSKLSVEQAKEYEYYLKIKGVYEGKQEEIAPNYMMFSSMIVPNFKESHEVVTKFLKKDSYTQTDLDKLKTDEEKVKKAANALKKLAEMLQTDVKDLPNVMEDYTKYFEGEVKYRYNLDFNPRTIVGDNYADLTEKFYGNNEVKGPDAEHGTHVSGIIAANRKNKVGIQGIADNVKIMAIRAVPDGDERDKDVANAIRYAVDNGAKVINMSFGKDYSPQKQAVDEAVKYAESKDVLLVHAAGNDSEDVDVTSNFPSKKLLKGDAVNNWIEVGASSWGGLDNFVGDFSNYGQTSVDIFAPGVDIYSTIQDNEYKSNDGTSMASPVVAGVAALVRSYFPELNAIQVKEVLLKSSVKYDKEVNMPGDKSTRVEFSKLSATGGVVNAYQAVKMAMEMKK